jgi:hypothetical protein
MLVIVALLVGVLLVGRNALEPCVELCVQHHIKITIITGIAEMHKVWWRMRYHHISLVLHIPVLVGPALSSQMTVQTCQQTVTMTEMMVQLLYSL